MNRDRLLRKAWLIPAIALLAAPAPALAKKKKKKVSPPPIEYVQNPALANYTQGPAVLAYYRQWSGPQWFKDGGATAAQLAEILRRSQLDGLAQGAALASQVEQAALQAGSTNMHDRVAAEQILSVAWVTYVEAIQRPTNNVIYAYANLSPQPVQASRVLAEAAIAPSLSQHLDQVAQVNPAYARLRSAAWAQIATNPGASADPRVVKNLARLRSLPRSDRFALVNIATQTLTMYENDQPVDSMKVIVGTTELPTPMISSVIYYATFNPYWNVPEHLVRKTLAPNVLKGGMSYLTTRGYEVMSGWDANAMKIAPEKIDWKSVQAGTTRIRVRQLPGGGNSMGKLKFSFANGEDIFLHDTPSKHLFAKSQRALSNGCVRLEDARRFGRWLLNREPVAPSGEPEQFVQLPRGVPVYITYLTAQERDGKIAYLDDVYGWDAGGAFSSLGSSASAAR